MALSDTQARNIEKEKKRKKGSAAELKQKVETKKKEVSTTRPTSAERNQTPFFPVRYDYGIDGRPAATTTSLRFGERPLDILTERAMMGDSAEAVSKRAKEVREKITASDLKAKIQDPAVQAQREALGQRQKKMAEQTLSERDAALRPAAQAAIREAKVDYDTHKEAGYTEGMKLAHERAEAIRNREGYSGGIAGDQYITGNVDERDFLKLNQQGEARLRKAALELAMAQATGNTTRIREAQAEIDSIKSAPRYRNEANLTADGRTVDVGAMTEEERQELREGEKRFQEGLYSVMSGIPGSVMSFFETTDQAIDNDVIERNRAYLQDKAHRIYEYRRRLEHVRSGGVDEEGKSEKWLEQQVRIAQNAQRLLTQGTNVDPNLPGQTLMRKSAEAGARAVEGLSGWQSDLAQAAMSVGQNLPSIGLSLIPVVGPALGAGLMGAQSAGSRAWELNEQNANAEILAMRYGGTPEEWGAVSPAEASFRGLLSGLVETGTERIGLGRLAKLLTGKGGKGFVKNVLAQMGIEGTEESIAYTANYVLDKIHQDPTAQWSPEELWDSFRLGAIAGGMMAAPASLIGNRGTATTPPAEPDNPLLRAARQREVEETTDVGETVREEPRRTEREESTPGTSGQEILIRKATEDIPQTVQNAPEQTFEQPRQETPVRAETPVQGAERVESEREGVVRERPAETQAKSEETPLPEAMGAMSRGGAGEFSRWQAETPGSQFHPINERASDQAAELHGRGQTEVPTRNLDGLLTNKSLSTMANAGVTPNEVVQGMLDRAAAGGFSRVAYGDNAAIQYARSQIESSGYQAMRDKWIKDITNGKSSKDTTVMGEILFQQAANSGTPEGIADALEIAALYDEYCTRTSRAFQAMNIMNKLTPEGNLYTISRSVERMTEQALEREVGRTSNQEKAVNDEILQVTESERANALAEIAELERALREEARRREDAENVLLQTANAFREEQPDDFGGWVSEIAKDLANNLSSRLSRPQDTIQPISRIVLSDLVKFAEENALPQGAAANKRKRTAAERIADYFNNREEYDRAWAEAQNAIREKYKDNPAALAAFGEWLSTNSAYSLSGDSPVVLRAISETIAAEEISKVQRDMRAAYDFSALADQVFGQINETVNATGQDAVQLQLAIENAFYQQGQTVDTERRIQADIGKALRDIGVKMRDIIVRGADTKQTLADRIANMLVQDYGISSEGASALSADVVDAFDARVLEASQRELANRFKDRPKRVQKSADQKLRELANLGAFTSPQYNTRATEKLYGIPNVTIDPALAQAFLNAKTELEVVNAKEAIYKHIGKQVPSTWEDKFNAWRYTSMLGTLRTFLKNALGNVPTIPMRQTKDIVGTGLERMLGTEERTKSVLNPLSQEDRARRAVAKDDFRNVRSYIMSGGALNEGFGGIREHQTVFSGILTPMEYYRKATNFAMETGDVIFSKLGYTDALAGYLKVNKITAEQYAGMTPSEKAKAREYAINYAQKAVFRDINDFSKLVSSLGKLQRSDNKAARVVGVLVEGILPFKKTPANIAARAVEYSPVGLAVGIRKAVNDVRSGSKTSAEAIEWLSSGLVGTGVAGLGALLGGLGFVTGGGTGDDKQDDFNELQGHQNYAFEVGGTSVPIDWLAPASLPFFVGVEFQRFAKRAAEGDWDSNQSILKAILGIAEPMLSMSMLQSLEDVLSDVGFADNKTVAFLATSAVNYLTQFIPTLFGQIERTTEPTRQMTFVDRDSWIPTEIQRALGKAFNKLPGEFAQVDYVDEWGRTEDQGNAWVRAFNNFINPSYTSKIQTGSTEAELQRLYDLGYEGVLPSSFATNTRINGEYVSADQWFSMQTERGQTARVVLDSFLGTPQYNAMSDDEKAEFARKVQDYAYDRGKVKGGADADETYSRWQEAAKNAKREVGLSEADVITASAYLSVLGAEVGDEATANVKQGMFEQWVDSRTDLTEEQQDYLKENIKFYTMVPASSGKYNAIVDSGYTSDEAQVLLSARSEYADSSNGLYEFVISQTDDYAEQEKLFGIFKDKGSNKTWGELATEQAAVSARIDTAKTNLDNTMDAERQEAFAEAVNEYGKGSRYAVYQGLMSIEATDAERQAYYEYIKAQRTSPWKASWAQMKANGGYP